VITDSSSARDDFLRFQDYPPERVIAIPLAVSPSFHAATDVRDSYPPTEYTILHVGHSGFYKNIESVLRAMPLIQRKVGLPVQFCKVGGFTPSQRELIRKLRINSLVEPHGTLSERSLAELYRKSSVLVMPSLHEGFGLPILEAMASGTPVLASNRGSLPEVVGDAGLMVEPDDIEGIAEGVARLITDYQLRDDMITRGLERARQFTWQRTARATLDVYRSVVAEAS
jgi:glycosyltransferase involved in cell wall biosynthesis